MLHRKGNSNKSFSTIANCDKIQIHHHLLCTHMLQPFAIVQHGRDFCQYIQDRNSFYYVFNEFLGKALQHSTWNTLSTRFLSHATIQALVCILNQVCSLHFAHSLHFNQELMTSSHLFPLGCHFGTIEKIDYYFRFFKYQLSVVGYLVNQVASMKNLVTMAPRVIEVWRVENAYPLETTSIHNKQSDSVACKA